MKSLKFSFLKRKKRLFFPQKKIGIALGSGGAKGISHIGVLEILEKNKVIINEISGCSIGAIIGALYASGVEIEEIKKIALSINFMKSLELFDFTNPKEGGLVKGHVVENFLNSILPVKHFQDLKIPFKCVATDMETKKEIVFSKGDLIPAIRSSISIPGFFVPYNYKNRTCIDGGVVNPVPVNLLTKSDYRIAVIVEEYDIWKKIDAHIRKIENKISSILKDELFSKIKLFTDLKTKRQHKKMGTIDVLSSTFDIMTRELAHFNIDKFNIDMVIRPKVKNIPTLAFYEGKKSYKEGVKAIKAVLPEILQDIQ